MVIKMTTESFIGQHLAGQTNQFILGFIFSSSPFFNQKTSVPMVSAYVKADLPL